MIATCEPSLLDLWRWQIGRRRCDPRPLAAMGYLANGPVIEELIEIDKLVLAVVYDETVAFPTPDSAKRNPLRGKGFGTV